MSRSAEKDKGGRYAVVIGEALVDMIEGRCDGQEVYRPMLGGSPFNTAVGLGRLGNGVEFVGSFGSDAFADRLRRFLHENGVGTAASARHPEKTCLALTTLEDGKPRFEYYGSPRVWGLLYAEQLDMRLLERSSVLHCGSTAFLGGPILEAVRAAYGVSGPIKTMDPNPRASLIEDVRAYRKHLEGFYGLVDLVKLSDDDASLLYCEDAVTAARHIQDLGVRTVVVTRGAQGAVVLHESRIASVEAKQVAVLDTTGAGDAFMAGIIDRLIAGGVPPSIEGWVRILERATEVAAVVCRSPGGASAMPTREDLENECGGWPQPVTR